MKRKTGVMLTALLVAAIVLSVEPMTRASPPAPPAFWVVPETETFTASNASVGTRFNVTVWAGTTAAQTTAWQVKLAFDPTQIQAVVAFVTGGATSQWFSGHIVFAGSPVIDNTTAVNPTGTVLIAETLAGIDFVGPSSGSLFTVTFQIMATPAPGTTLTSLIDTATYAPGDTFVLDQDGNTETPFATAHCTYTFSGGGTPPPTRHDVAVSSVTPASGQVNQGSSLSIQVVALNNGTVTETFGVNATYDGTLIGTQTVTSLAAASTQTLTFSWNTAGVAAGTYTITATAVPVAGETDLSNNAKTAQVQVIVPRHDVAVSSVTPASGQVNQGSSLSIQVVALNNGTVTETFGVNATYDGTLIGTQTVTSLAAGGTQLLNFTWNTAGVATGNYTITATAVPVAGETDLSNNAKTAQVEVVVAHYDLDGDGKVDVKDIGIAARAFGATPGTPRWNPAADVDGSGVVTIMDIALVAQQFGK